MRAGRLDRLVTIQRKTTALSGSGDSTDTWNDIAGASRRPASMRPVRGDERFATDQNVASEQVEFRIRYSANLVDLSPLDRIIHPALSDASPREEPTTRQIYDVSACYEIGRREGLQIITTRRADVTS